MMKINDLYDYGLKICQNEAYFKFSLDSILLSEFVKFKKNDKILDMCTGNLPIPLIISTKSLNVNITAVEIQQEVFELAKKTLEINELTNRIELIQGDIRVIKFKEKFDIVVANPPYFKVTDSSLKNAVDIKSIARHEIKLTLEETIKTAVSNLKETGTFFMVQRVDRFLETLELLKNNKLGIRRAVFVYTKKDADAEFFLIEASKYKKSDLKVRSLYIEGLNTYKSIFEEW